MKIAIIGSRNLNIDNLEKFLPKNVSEIVSGGARGIDSCVARYAKESGIKITVFTPEYEKYGRAAPLKRNLQIINHADELIAFWDGKSNGTRHVIGFILWGRILSARWRTKFAPTGFAKPIGQYCRVWACSHRKNISNKKRDVLYNF